MKRATLALLLAGAGSAVVGYEIGAHITEPYDPALDDVERRLAQLRREDAVLYAGVERLQRAVNMAGVQ